MNDGRTHYEGCWRAHHDCAVAEVERLRSQFANSERERKLLRAELSVTEDACAMLEADVERLRAGHDRYEWLRRQGPRYVLEIWNEALRAGNRLDDLIDERRTGPSPRTVQPVDQLPEQADEGYLDDGFGSRWHKCQPYDKCRMQIVRPGHADCDCTGNKSGTDQSA